MLLRNKKSLIRMHQVDIKSITSSYKSKSQHHGIRQRLVWSLFFIKLEAIRATDLNGINVTGKVEAKNRLVKISSYKKYFLQRSKARMEIS